MSERKNQNVQLLKGEALGVDGKSNVESDFCKAPCEGFCQSRAVGAKASTTYCRNTQISVG